jgi:hypothetical protein
MKKIAVGIGSVLAALIAFFVFAGGSDAIKEGRAVADDKKPVTSRSSDRKVKTVSGVSTVPTVPEPGGIFGGPTNTTTTTVVVPAAARVADASIPQVLATSGLDEAGAAIKFVSIWESLVQLDATKASKMWLTVVEPDAQTQQAEAVIRDVQKWQSQTNGNGRIRIFPLATQVRADDSLGAGARVVEVWQLNVITVAGSWSRSLFTTTVLTLKPAESGWVIVDRMEVRGPAPEPAPQPATGGSQVEFVLSDFVPVHERN